MPIRFRQTKRKDGCRVVFAYDGKIKVGWVGACPTPRNLEVMKAHVLEGWRRQGIGTALYERMAQTGCKIGLPMASWVHQRSHDSRAFWDKQHQRGRAIRDPRDPLRSVIPCPAPTLAGELIPGGLAPGGKCPRRIPAKEIARGVQVELEHTSSRRIAREIACDHFTEDPRYYRKLARVEAARSRR